MSVAPDPFRHHPELRALVTPPEQSQLRDITSDYVRARLAEVGLPDDFIQPDADREASRKAALAGREGADLWVFAYGSLMWDPAVSFAEVRRAHVPGVERRFILRDTGGGRGTPEAPGVMAALDRGPAGCDGLVFRIEAGAVEAESRRLWNRECIGTAYEPAFVPAQTRQGPVEALTFLANHGSVEIAGDLDHAAQVRLCATGAGLLGTSLEYLENLARHFEALQVSDAAVTGLLDDVRAFLRGGG